MKFRVTVEIDLPDYGPPSHPPSVVDVRNFVYFGLDARRKSDGMWTPVTARRLIKVERIKDAAK